MYNKYLSPISKYRKKYKNTQFIYIIAKDEYKDFFFSRLFSYKVIKVSFSRVLISCILQLISR